MTLVAGIDPGASGAVAVYCATTRRLLSTEDLPTYHVTVGRKQRKRLDPIALMELCDTLKMMGVSLAVIEAVGGRPGQSASAGFQFGMTVGLIYANLLRSGVMVEPISPQAWKKVLKVPGKLGSKEARNSIKAMPDGTEKNKAKRVAVKQAEGDIINRVHELFPDDRQQFLTERGAYRMDRAEAALLAKYGGDFVVATYEGGKNWDDMLRERYDRMDV